MARLDLELQPASLDDAKLVADLDLRRDPDADVDPVRMRHWWSRTFVTGPVRRMLAKRGGKAVAFAAVGHDHWKEGSKRYGWTRVALDQSVWSEARYRSLVAGSEQWLREEGADAIVLRVSDRLSNDVELVKRIGYAEGRRARISELAIAARRDELNATRDACRAKMASQGVVMHTLVGDGDPDLYMKLYSLVIESEQDIPTTTPLAILTLDEWKRFWFEDPGMQKDRLWIAREGDDVVGVSMLDYPMSRGVPFTNYTGTLRRVRGRGIAKALKYETISQAIDLGFARVRTQNDGDNEPILRINEAMGYQPVHNMLEMHRELT